jgi:hypothetical protein
MIKYEDYKPLFFFLEVENQPQETLDWHNQVGDC